MSKLPDIYEDFAKVFREFLQQRVKEGNAKLPYAVNIFAHVDNHNLIEENYGLQMHCGGNQVLLYDICKPSSIACMIEKIIKNVDKIVLCRTGKAHRKYNLILNLIKEYIPEEYYENFEFVYVGHKYRITNIMINLKNNSENFKMLVFLVFLIECYIQNFRDSQDLKRNAEDVIDYVFRKLD